MSIVERAKNICLTPNTEWPIIAAEPTSPGTLVTDYVVPLAAVGAIAGFIGGSMAWIASALQIVPLLGVFAFFAALYGLYLLYLGLRRLMKCQEQKAVAYTALVVVCAIIVSMLITAVGGTIAGAAVGAGIER